MPYEVLELILMEKFGWTPMQIDEIPFKRMKQIMDVMNIRAQVQANHAQSAAALEGADKRVVEELSKARKKGGIIRKVPV